MVRSGSASDGLRILEEGHRAAPSFFPLSEALAGVYFERGAYAQAETMGRALLEPEPKDPVGLAGAAAR